MSIEIEDSVKARLALNGPELLFGDSDARKKMKDDRKLIALFDKVWEERLRDAFSQATPCDYEHADFMLTEGQRHYLYRDQEHLQFRLEEEDLEFIAQVKKDSPEDPGSLTQLWRVVAPDVRLNLSGMSDAQQSDTRRKELYFKLYTKQQEALVWSEVYFRMGEVRRNWYLWIGGLAAIAAVFAGSTFLAGEAAPTTTIKAAITLIVGALTALQTFLDLGRQSEKFEAAGKGWGKLARKIDQVIWDIRYKDSDPDSQFENLKSVIEEMNELEDFSPTISTPRYKEAKARIEKRVENKKPGIKSKPVQPLPAPETSASPE